MGSYPSYLLFNTNLRSHVSVNAKMSGICNILSFLAIQCNRTAGVVFLGSTANMKRKVRRLYCLNAVSVPAFIVFNNTHNHLQYNGQADQDSQVITTGWSTTVSMSNSSTSTNVYKVYPFLTQSVQCTPADNARKCQAVYRERKKNANNHM